MGEAARYRHQVTVGQRRKEEDLRDEAREGVVACAAEAWPGHGDEGVAISLLLDDPDDTAPACAAVHDDRRRRRVVPAYQLGHAGRAVDWGQLQKPTAVHARVAVHERPHG